MFVHMARRRTPSPCDEDWQRCELEVDSRVLVWPMGIAMVGQPSTPLSARSLSDESDAGGAKCAAGFTDMYETPNTSSAGDKRENTKIRRTAQAHTSESPAKFCPFIRLHHMWYFFKYNNIDNIIDTIDTLNSVLFNT